MRSIDMNERALKSLRYWLAILIARARAKTPLADDLPGKKQ